MELNIRAQIKAASPLKSGNGQVSSYHTLKWVELLIHIGIKANHVSEKGPGDAVNDF